MRRRRQFGIAMVMVAALAACQSGGAGPDAPPRGTALPQPPGPVSPDPSEAAPSGAAPSEADPTAAAGGCVDRTLAGLSLSERAGQVLMIGTAVDEPGGLGDIVQRYHLGGVFLHGRTTASAATLQRGIAGLQRRADLPLLVSLDQEGGSVQTLKGADFPILPSAQRLGGGSAATLRSTTQDSARRLAAIGVTMNLAPVADTVPTSVGTANPPIGAFRRQFGAEPDRVAAAIRTVVPASQQQGVLTVVKHFPGLGRVRANTDTSTKAVDSVATGSDPFLEPFVAGIDAGTAAVMMSSASYPKLDRTSPVAAFSRPIVTGLLRERLGYRGLVMSDDLGAGVAVGWFGPGDRAVRFVAAGGDLVLSIRPSDAARMAGALIDRAEQDRTFAARLTDAARQVLIAKQRVGILPCS